MIRVAIVGYSGSGRTTLANALAGMTFACPIHKMDELWTTLQSEDSVILDGLPRTVQELEQIDGKAPPGRGVEHVLYLQADADLRLERIARTVVSGVDPARARERLLHPVDLKHLRTYLEPSGRLTVIDANRSRSEVLLDALEAIGIGV